MRTILLFAVFVCACDSAQVQHGSTSSSSPSCAGIDPPDAVSMQQYIWEPDPHGIDGAICQSGTGDANGTVALPMMYGHGSLVAFVDPNSRLLRLAPSNSMVLNVLGQPSGFVSVGDGPYIGPWVGPDIQFVHWDRLGTPIGDDIGAVWHVEQFASAAAPAGGAFVTGDLQPDPSGPVQHAALMVTGGGEAQAIKWGPRQLASAEPVYAAGVDSLGRSIAITVSSGNLTGQWFEADGTPLTGEFTLVKDLAVGQNMHFETAPLIGGGVVVQRLEPDDHWLNRHAHALVVVESGTTSVQTAPQWMIDRPDTRLRIARRAKAYAVLPFGATASECTQRVEIVASDGTSCGVRDYRLADGTCDTKDITLGLDGTVIQQLPEAMETVVSLGPFDRQTCTWRWWPAAVR